MRKKYYCEITQHLLIVFLMTNYHFQQNGYTLCDILSMKLKDGLAYIKIILRNLKIGYLDISMGIRKLLILRMKKKSFQPSNAEM